MIPGSSISGWPANCRSRTCSSTGPRVTHSSWRRCSRRWPTRARWSGSRAAMPWSGTPVCSRCPPSVRTLLADRIDRLQPEEREVLRAAAVIGNGGALRLLESVTALPARSFRTAVRRLIETGFLLRGGSRSRPTYAFRHGLTQEVAYAEILHRQRRMLHARVVERVEACGERTGRPAPHGGTGRDARRPRGAGRAVADAGAVCEAGRAACRGAQFQQRGRPIFRAGASGRLPPAADAGAPDPRPRPPVRPSFTVPSPGPYRRERPAFRAGQADRGCLGRRAA